jgi:two-component system sensor histidine kinase GlrK
MTRKLGDLDRIKRSFVSKVSHDLKTPLASMRETVQAMLDGVPGPITGRQRRLLELTNESAVRLSSMIAKILDLSALEAGALVLEVRRHEVRSLIDPAVHALELGDPDRRPPIEVELSPFPLWIECDRDRTVQVLVNLLENAVKFSPEGAPVRVSARLVAADEPSVPKACWQRVRQPQGGSGAALIEVSDAGPGISEVAKRRIFEDYFQASVSHEPRSRGVGLGLAICREIVDLHGGAIWVCDNPGGGSTFAVLLPAATVETMPVGGATHSAHRQLQAVAG